MKGKIMKGKIKGKRRKKGEQKEKGVKGVKIRKSGEKEGK